MSHTRAAGAQPAGPVCPGCGRRALQDDRFCGNCGTELPLQEPPGCPACKGAIGPDDSFCGACGAALSIDARVDSAPPARPVGTARRARRKTAPRRARAAPAVASEATSSAIPASPEPRAPETMARPSRFLPGTRAGRILLAGGAVLAAVAGLTAKSGGIELALMAVAALFCLFLVWRNILISFGWTGPSPRPRAKPPVPAEPSRSEPPAEGKGGASGTFQTVVLLVVILAGVALIRGCGRDFVQWLAGRF